MGTHTHIHMHTRTRRDTHTNTDTYNDIGCKRDCGSHPQITHPNQFRVTGRAFQPHISPTNMAVGCTCLRQAANVLRWAFFFAALGFSKPTPGKAPGKDLLEPVSLEGFEQSRAGGRDSVASPDGLAGCTESVSARTRRSPCQVFTRDPIGRFDCGGGGAHTKKQGHD